MQKKNDEVRSLVKKFSDKARTVQLKGNQFTVPHKFTPDGEVINESNLDARRDISRLNLEDFRLLAALQDHGWDLKAAAESVGQEVTQAQQRYKKLSYFKFEEQKSQSLAAVASASFVTAKNVEGFYQDNLSDGQRDHLKELAKITGAYKPTTNINMNVSAFVKPQLSPEAEKATREFFDTIATQDHAA
jgi:pyridoxine 5'-phosphate synthase PdxJ